MSLVQSSFSTSHKKILHAHEMAEADSHAISVIGIPSRVLMEHAAMACVRDLLVSNPDIHQKNIFVFAGKGHNGGDGILIARILKGMGVSVKLISLTPSYEGTLKEVWDSCLKVLPESTVCLDRDTLESEVSKIPNGAIIIDAICGTGFKGSSEGFLKIAFETLNIRSNNCHIYAVDIPSGNNADEISNEYEGVNAHCTWALQCLKPIHVNPYADKVCGDVKLLDIGIPEQCYSSFYSREVISKSRIARLAKQAYPKSENSYKGDKGHVLIIGGAEGTEGAAVLSSLAALRAGAGLVTVARPTMKEDSFIPPEVMQKVPPRSLQGTFGPFDLGFWEEVLEKKSSIVIGPGMGTDASALEVFKFIISYVHDRSKEEHGRISLVVDADAISLLAENFAELSSFLGDTVILTPHFGEFSRLIKKTVVEIKAERLGLSYEFIRNYKSVLLLKGPYSVITTQEKQYVSPYKVSALGTAGSGDVLSGIIGTYLAKGLDPLPATMLAVSLHAESGKMWQEKKGVNSGMLASEIAQILPETFKKIISSEDHSVGELR